KTAIKKMTMLATREFLAEMKVLTSVHHRNLVRLIGYCIEGSLFLVERTADMVYQVANCSRCSERPRVYS
ncbi:chitin elicitor receptor kinase 1-like, partial [Trifolium medium]|nr:chitin elicitor receptor kinase 1-like [Trifolium medium]